LSIIGMVCSRYSVHDRERVQARNRPFNPRSSTGAFGHQQTNALILQSGHSE